MPGEPIRWARLEPRSRDGSLAAGLEARVHDPLWLLGRQWQFGELDADADRGSAVVAELTADVAPLTSLRRGPDAAAEPYAVADVPLEALVEAEDVRAAPTARMRARAGRHFERLLAAHGAERYAEDYRRAYPIAPAARELDPASRRFLAVVAGRVIDGERLFRELAAALRAASPALPAAPAVDAADVDRVRAAAEAFLVWADALVMAPAGAAPAAWTPDRLEYAFGVTAADGTGLEASEYADGRLDWHSFVTNPDRAPAAGAVTLGPLTVVPTAVTFPGMPGSRLWEFEDARVDFGGVEARPTDLGRLLLTEFALVYGADWLLVPLEVPVGALVEVTRLAVRDTFGRTVTIPPTAELGGPPPEWDVFSITRAEGPPGRALLVAPALAAGLQGAPVEDVLLVRDEAANLAWAIERAIEGEDGRPVDRARVVAEGAPAEPPPAAAPDTRAYRLRTDVPEHWLPLLPRRADPDPSMTLRLGALPRVAPDGSIEPVRPLGQVLQGPDVVLREEEVPREGARVTRAYQLARWMDGTTVLWLGRRKAVGRGEGSSGLRFDVMEP